jgi:GMP synthase (glutamine-hydrolysing)
MAAAQELGGQKRSRTNTNSTASSGSEDEPSFKKDKIELAESESEINKVAILDAGAQYGKIIDRRVREQSVKAELLPINTPASDIVTGGYKAVIISGSPGSVSDPNKLSIDPTLLSTGIPILGICYGMQLLNKLHGGQVAQRESRADGQFAVTLDTACPLFSDLGNVERVLLTHGDSMVEEDIAEELSVVSTCGRIVTGVAHKTKPIFGLQFHPETDLTPNGPKMLGNFLFKVANITPCFTILTRIDSCVKMIQEAVGDKKVLVLVSGGVDSTVCAALMNKALGPERVVPLHIDTGFMRKEESVNVQESLKSIGVDLTVVTAKEDFYTSSTHIFSATGQEMTTKPLRSVMHPEHKRNIIGDAFIKVVMSEVPELCKENSSYFLSQGTLRPDLIESASSLVSGHADKIKTHHNDTRLVRIMREQGHVIEPLKDFHKDEVKEIGKDLGLPDYFVKRHPFPGPGLAIRILCADLPYISEDYNETNVKLKLLVDFEQTLEQSTPVTKSLFNSVSSEADRKFLLSLSTKYNLHATLLPVRSVGVQGDRRSYNHPAAISCDIRPPWKDLINLAKIIPRVVHNVNRVVWVFGGPTDNQIEDITPTFLTRNNIAKLREADARANETLVECGEQKHDCTL